MDYLQYRNALGVLRKMIESFKPCYKWITFNTVNSEFFPEILEEF